MSSRTGRPKRTRGPRSLQQRLEEHGAGVAVWSWPARFAHADVRIGGWLVEPRGRHSLLAPAAQERDQPVGVHKLDRALEWSDLQRDRICAPHGLRAPSEQRVRAHEERQPARPAQQPTRRSQKHRSDSCSCGRASWRRRTASSCRSTTISSSLNSRERSCSAATASERRNSRYTSEINKRTLQKIANGKRDSTTLGHRRPAAPHAKTARIYVPDRAELIRTIVYVAPLMIQRIHELDVGRSGNGRTVFSDTTATPLVRCQPHSVG